MAKILVAMSGGVDSTSVALALKTQGHSIEGCYLKLHDDAKKHEQNIAMVEKAARFLDIKYHVLDLSDEFEKIVYQPFIQAYKSGVTPNPCVLCNRNIKFGALVDFAKSRGFEKLATGHYVQIKNALICEAADKSKDQSYFLAQVDKSALEFMLFPLGDKYKKNIKLDALQIPQLSEFSTQKESSEICFVQDSYIDVLKKFTNTDTSGEVVNTKGEVIGTHKGYMHYTIGKRRGFEVHGAHDAHYVVRIIPSQNRIVVGSKEDLLRDSFSVGMVNMFVEGSEFECSVKIRYRSPKLKCKLKISDDGKSAFVTMSESASAIASGQLAAFYQGEFVIGSGVIE